jgi:hypothetical protein
MAFPVGLTKTSNVAMAGASSGAGAGVGAGELSAAGVKPATTASAPPPAPVVGTTITGIPPPPAGAPEPPASSRARYVKFTVPPGAGGDWGVLHVRIQVPNGRLGGGPVVEVGLEYHLSRYVYFAVPKIRLRLFCSPQNTITFILQSPKHGSIDDTPRMVHVTNLTPGSE